MEHKPMLDKFPSSPRSRKSQTAIGWDEYFCARTTRLQPKIDHKQSATEMKLIGSLCCFGKNGPVDQRDHCQEAERSHERLCEEDGKDNTRLYSEDQVRQQFRIRFRAFRPQNGLEVVRPIHQQVLHPQVGKQLHGENLHHGMSHVFSLAGNEDSLVSHGMVHTGPRTPSRSRTRDFSRVVFLVGRVSVSQRLSHAHVLTTQDLHVKRCVLTFCDDSAII